MPVSRIARYAAATGAAALAAGAFWPGGVHWIQGSTATPRNLVRAVSPLPTTTAVSATHPAGHHLARHAAPVVTRRAVRSRPTTEPPITRPVAPAVLPAPTVAPLVSDCAAAIAAVEAKRLHPAPGYVVLCPGNAEGRQGMTCRNVPGICLGQKIIAIAVVDTYVVANEFENSRIFAGLPVVCDTIDCGGSAYGF